MTDRELLCLAAKAARYDFIEKRFDSFPSDYELYLRSRHPARTSDYPTLWNPLTNDGDALRLAVKLRLFESAGLGNMEEMDDPYAATRRAIVMAAAEIGAHGIGGKA